MELLPKELEDKIPKLYVQEKRGDNAVVHLKFFDPCSQWTWFVLEYDGIDSFFGLVIGHETEFGYFSLKELQSYKGPFGIGIERDLYFTPMRLGKLKQLCNI